MSKKRGESQRAGRGASSQRQPAAGGSGDPRYVVGIDLGTTNTALAWVDLQAAASAPRGQPVPVTSLPIPQLVRAGTTQSLSTLPSTLYLPGPEVAADSAQLPFSGAAEGTICGAWASELGSKVPSRLVVSSKSWLCHAGVDRAAPILPFGSDAAEVPKLSPVEAAKRLLLHVRAAWDAAMAAEDPSAALARQEVLLCVPASFDPAARDLTIEAARQAGLERVTLLEEPQAAFYAWIERESERWREQLQPGDLALVVDVGGGTTDLTLIAVKDEGGSLALERVAVGDHLLLGGDNMDLALAHLAAGKLGGNQLDPWQSRALWLACRRAKEELLAHGAPETADVVVLGRGSKLIGGTIKTQLERTEVEQVVLGGFFPACPPDARPQRRRAAGLSELGLPFEPDAAITRHLAGFLGREDASDGKADGMAFPSAVLFNGGVFKSPRLREAVLGALNGWLEAAGKPAARVLPGEDLDLAVARGAAYYGLVRRGRGVRIRGGTARTYYVGVESTLPAVPGLPPPLKALCVAPAGMEEGTSAELPAREFALMVGEPATFRFLGSSQHREDAPGSTRERWAEGELVELAPLQVTLPAGPGEKAGSTVPVRLQSSVTEVGTLEVHCVARDGRRFKLEWNVREA